MKKFLISLLLILLMASISYGAASEDVYLRKDLFEAKMDAVIAEMRALRSDVQGEIRSVNARLDAMNTRLEDLKTSVYWGFSILGLFIALITFAPTVGEAVKNMRKPEYATLEDVKRLRAESKLEAK